MRATFPLDPEPEGLAYTLTPEIERAADRARPWVEWVPKFRNARDRGTPVPPKPEGV